MRFHIIRSNETIYDILSLYNLTKDELIKENKHITSWRNLVPGTKLKIPPIPESVEQTVKDMEPFIEDYYPKLKNFTIKTEDKNINLDTVEVKEEEKIVEEPKLKFNIKDIPELQDIDEEDSIYNSGYQYPHYGYYPNYYQMAFYQQPTYSPLKVPTESEEE